MSTPILHHLNVTAVSFVISMHTVDSYSYETLQCRRFDPYGPPGGPTEPGRGGRFPGRGSRMGRGRGRGGRGRRGRMPPGGFGGPNPDHMQPPGGGYFS